MKYLAMVLLAISLTSCGTRFKVVMPDADTGHFAGDIAYRVGKATIITSKPLEFERYDSLLVVTAGDFIRDSMRNTDYFAEVIDFEELQKRIIQRGLDNEITDISGLIGMKKVAERMGPFLWLRFDEHNVEHKEFARLKLTDPLTADDVLIAEAPMDYVRGGGFDHTTWYPLLNAVVDWLKENQHTETL